MPCMALFVAPQTHAVSNGLADVFLRSRWSNQISSLTLRLDDRTGHWLYPGITNTTAVIALPAHTEGPLNLSIASVSLANGDERACPPSVKVLAAGTVSAEQPAATSQPVVSPSTRVSDEPAACDVPFVPARVLTARSPVMPPLAVESRVSGVVTVLVALEADGSVAGATILSSPSTLVNDSALAAARGSTFAPETFRCRPSTGDYTFLVEFTAR